jgi:hypothetical protein
MKHDGNPEKCVLHHEGLIYVRPVGRGICVVDADGEVGDHLDDHIESGYYRATIIIEEQVPDPKPYVPPHARPIKPFDPYISGDAS